MQRATDFYKLLMFVSTIYCTLGQQVESQSLLIKLGEPLRQITFLHQKFGAKVLSIDTIRIEQTAKM